MELTLLITKAAFAGYEDIAVNIEPTRVNVAIKKAQELDLKPFMGQQFYYDFVKNIVFNQDGVTLADTVPQIYQDLYNGKDYTDKQGNFLYYPGIIPIMVYWAMARFTDQDYVRFTATGPVHKTNDQSTPLSATEMSKLVQNYRSIANGHLNDAILFLNLNRDIYPLWRYNAKNANSRQPGPRLRVVDRTDVRRVYGPNGYGFYTDGFTNGLI